MNEILQKKIEKAANKICCTDCPFESIRNCKECVEKENAIKTANFALQNQWIPVSEALPDNDENVLLIFDDGHIIVAYHSENYWWWCDGFVCGTKTNGQPMYSSSQRVDDKPTHWMPIQQPKGGE